MKKLLTPKPGRRHLLLSGAALPLLAFVNGCGYVLYPERKGRTGGNIDTPILVVDLLWLLPGILPGVIFLIVDFTTGCIYKSGGRASTEPLPGESGRRLATATVDLDGAVVANGEVHYDRSARLRWNHLVDDAGLKARGRLILRRPDGAFAEAFVRDLI